MKPITLNGEGIVVAVLIVMTGTLWAVAPALAQVKNTGTKSDTVTLSDGTRGKNITTYTNYENGDETIEVRHLDARGKLRARTFTAIKLNGEQTKKTEHYEGNEQIATTETWKYDASGKQTELQIDIYENGVLAKGTILEYDEKGELHTYKQYNPTTQRYENAAIPKFEFKGRSLLDNYYGWTKTDTKSKGPSNTKQGRGANEEVNEAWWQYFTADKEGLANLKLAILDCDRELSKAVQKWLDAVQAAGEQNRKAVKARNAVRPALHRARLAKDAAAKAKPDEKEAKEKAAAKAQEEAEAAQKAAETESKKEIDANKALSEAEKNVDPNVRKMVKEATEKQIEKEKQERAEEKPTKTPQKTKQERVDDRPNTKGPPPCPPKTVKGGGGKIDACLVGEWRAESLASEVGYRGGSGILLTINGGGIETIDYTGMKPITGNGETHQWRGIVVAEFTTDKATANVTKAVKADLTVKQTYSDGRVIEKQTKALGPAALGNFPQDRSYACDGTTLKFKGVLYTSTFKREKK